jgi:hypothetical protein
MQWLGLSTDGSDPPSKNWDKCAAVVVDCFNYYCLPDGGCDYYLGGCPGIGPEICETCVPIGSAGSALVDMSHGQGAIDVSGVVFDLESRAWAVDFHNSGEIIPSLLEPYDALIIPPPPGLGIPNMGPGIEPFTATEVAAVASFFASGHGLWIFSEYLQDPTGVNSVSSQFGVTFNADVIEDPDEMVSTQPIISVVASHPITEGIDSYRYIVGCSLNASPPSLVLATADENAFSDGYSDGYPPGSFPPALAVAENSAGGCAVFHGDWHGPGQLVTNILDCLAFDGPIAVEASSWGSIKARYRR